MNIKNFNDFWFDLQIHAERTFEVLIILFLKTINPESKTLCKKNQDIIK